MKSKKINTVQMAVLRRASGLGVGHGVRRIESDGSTAKALLARGFAYTDKDGEIYITEAGIERAQKAADIHVLRDGVANDPTLMQDL
jgi:sarcosine oxidase gamma subunit